MWDTYFWDISYSLTFGSVKEEKQDLGQPAFSQKKVYNVKM